MGFRWRQFGIPRFLGLDLKTNVVDVRDGRSLDCENVFQNGSGKMSLRHGTEPMFTSDEAGTIPNNGVGSCTLAGIKFWFKFSDGKFHYSIAINGATTTIAPAPPISTTEEIWFSVLDNKLFFVDATNALRFFDGVAIKDSTIYERPTVPPTSASAAGTFTYLYTIDNGLGESPASPILVSKISGAVIRVPENTGSHTLVVGDIVRIYSRADSIAAASKLVATHLWTAADDLAGFADIATSPISDGQPQLYTELGVAVNKSAPVGLVGITVHAGRLVGWMDHFVHNSKSSNPHSWPDDSAQKEAFVYGFGIGDGENISVCVSFRDSMFVMKPSSAAVFGGIGPDDTGNNAYSFRRMEVNGRGCIAGKSAVVIGEEDGNYLIWLSRYGFMASDYGKPVFLGEEIETQTQTLADNVLVLSCAYYDKKSGMYVCYVGSQLNRVAWVLDVRKERGQSKGQADDSGRVGWFKFTNIIAMHVFYDTDRALFGTPSGMCLSERVSGTTTDWQDTRQEYIIPAAINLATDEITVTQVYATGDPIRFRTTGTMPGLLLGDGTYYAIFVSNTLIKVALTEEDAEGGIAIDIGTQGTGVHSLVSGELIPNFYTTNWIAHGSGLVTKKLMKPGFIFNTNAQNINMKIEAAYDYVIFFQDAITVDISSSNPWGLNSWGVFVWGSGASADPRNIGQPRRKVKSIRYRFSVEIKNQDYELLGMEQPFDPIRNRGGYS